MLLADAEMSSRDLYRAFNTTKAGVATKVSKGIYSIKDLLVIVEAFGGEVRVELPSGMKIPLTIVTQEE